MFLSTKTANGTFFEDNRGLILLSDIELKNLKDNLEKQSNYFKEKEIPYLIVVCPDKASIYPEYLPSFLQKKIGDTRLEQIIKYLDNNSDVKIIDLRSVIRKNKNTFDQPLYYPQDSHWNYLGAYVGYQAIMNALLQKTGNQDYSPLPYNKISQINSPPLNALSTRLGIPKLNTKNKMMKLKKNFNNNHSLLIINDSFFYHMGTYFTGSFNKIMSIPNVLSNTTGGIESFEKSIMTPEKDFWNNINMDLAINKYKPDIVIFEFVQRNIPVILNRDFKKLHHF